MQVTKLEAVETVKFKVAKPTEDALKNEYEFLIAKNLTKKLLEKGFINQSEFDKIMAKNRETFSPFLAEIMA
ncbi:hypothetical protein Ana3638_23820 [Anaerocolumna sedimenticola]|uniref:SHOCT-like domain-containing protein n=1 Tax=Anaerocolumna sedimenticola TaxID=2696063 RepID=A0A6P1TVC7_9FIRM|nr:SHOCT domain-containing protein [Anaerocolumna sedimenticola]QHQ63428.1 hypothetical protein Ana3638_23820 [Anaerocolumna sedimenticola]